VSKTYENVQSNAGPPIKKPRKQKKSKEPAVDENQTVNQQAYVFYEQQNAAPMSVQAQGQTNYVQAFPITIADEEDDSELPPPPSVFYQMTAQYPSGPFPRPHG
jgi:hypothetical protein